MATLPDDQHQALEIPSKPEVHIVVGAGGGVGKEILMRLLDKPRDKGLFTFGSWCPSIQNSLLLFQ